MSLTHLDFRTGRLATDAADTRAALAVLPKSATPGAAFVALDGVEAMVGLRHLDMGCSSIEASAEEPIALSLNRVCRQSGEVGSMTWLPVRMVPYDVEDYLEDQDEREDERERARTWREQMQRWHKTWNKLLLS